MGSFVFIIKTFFLSCLIIAALQTPVKGVSLESHFYSFVKSQQFTNWLEQMSHGAVDISKKIYAKITGQKPSKIEKKVKTVEERLRDSGSTLSSLGQ